MTGDPIYDLLREHFPRSTNWNIEQARAALLTRLRAVAADEGVRATVRRAIMRNWLAEDAALTAFLDHLGGGRASGGEVGDV